MMDSFFFRASVVTLASLVALAASERLTAQSVQTRVDSARHEIIVEAGPFDVPAMDPEMAKDMDMDMSMHHDQEMRVFPFEWPVDGFGRGFRIEVRDASGNLLPRSLLHHLIAINFDRRQFIYSAAERLFGIGKESPEVSLPGTLVVPLDKGQHLGFYVMWHNEDRDLVGVTVRIVMKWVPAKAARAYTPVLPVYLDVANEIGGNNTFDVPPGKSTRTFDFEAPVGGQFFGVSGHLHDYGKAVRLDDGETGKTLVRLTATRSTDGRIRGVSRKIFLFRPLRLRGGHRYRIVAEYDSPLTGTIKDGAMASIVGVFAPDSFAQWPEIDREDAQFRRDIESLRLAIPQVETHRDYNQKSLRFRQ